MFIFVTGAIDLFSVDSTNGLVQLTSDLYVIEPTYTIDLEVQVSDKGTPSEKDAAIVKITIQPPIPEFIDSCPGPNNINEVWDNILHY